MADEPLPQAEDRMVPVYVPNSFGEPTLDVAKADLRDGVLQIQFSNSLSAVAVQRMISRGVLLGLQFVMLDGKKAEENPSE